MLALNQIIADEFEIRFVKASDGGDTLEKRYGSLVVAFARRDLVLFATASNKTAITALREAVAKVDGGDPNALSRQLYQRRANGWHAL